MAKYIGKSCKLSRRYGISSDISLKSRGNRDIKTKCKLKIPPGQHGIKKRKISNYGMQLSAKQMIKYTYGILEKQFKIYYNKALKKKGITGEILLQTLEKRLDNVVYRMGFASTRSESRQLVSHKSIIVNRNNKNIIVSIPSYSVEIGDIISVKESCKKQIRIKHALKYCNEFGFVSWISVDINKMVGIFDRVPIRDELPSEINEQLVIEFYSK